MILRYCTYAKSYCVIMNFVKIWASVVKCPDAATTISPHSDILYPASIIIILLCHLLTQSNYLTDKTYKKW